MGGLCIGDYVTLHNGRFGAYVGSEGIIKPDLTANVGGDFDANIFQIHLQRQYSAARELETFMVNYKVEENKSSLDEGMKQYLAALENGRNNEVALNNLYFENNAGQPVTFGMLVQLFHLKSKMYITINPKKLAANERESSLAYLDVNGNTYSWFKLMPRYKIDREGDRIMSGAEIYIAVAERASEFLHCADVAPRKFSQREINVSLLASSFQLDIFQSIIEAQQTSLALMSQLVYIFDPETRSNLAIGSKPLTSFDEKPAEDDGGGENPVSGSVGEPGDENTKAAEEDKYFHEFGDIVIDPTGEGIPDARTLWQIEGENPTKGGPILWRSVKVRFRHVASGVYIRMTSKDPSEEISVGNCIITTTADRGEDGTLFSFFEPNGGKYLRNSKALNISFNGLWLERGRNTDSLSYQVRGTRNRNSALSLVVNPFHMQPKIPRDDARSAPLDEYVAMSGRKYLQQYFEMTELPTNNSTTTLWPTALRSDMPFFLRLIESLVYFSQGFPISREKVQLGAEPVDPLLRPQRQRLLRELDAIEYVLRIIHKLNPISLMAENAKRKRVKVSEEEQSLIRMGHFILDRCFFFIYYSVLDNHDNQMYVADFIKVLLAHLSTQTLAGRCVTEMLSKNMELQETKIGEEEISIFVNQLRSSNMNSMYLNLLQSCCSCEGQGVDNNQCLVAELLFADTNDIIIEMHSDFNKPRLVTWRSDSIYIPREPIPGSPVLGEVLVTKGLPFLALAWTTNSIDCSPLGLFGKLSVTIEELYGLSNGEKKTIKAQDDLTKEKSASVLKLEEKKAASMNQKNAVAEYFINEMFLGAEMCMDRNYVAMHKLDPYFSYESLVTILKMDVQSGLKAAAARLLLCLHIDRDPQAETKIPCLTRSWTDIERNPKPQLPYVDPARRYAYGLVQQIISEHVQYMEGRKWDPYSKYVLEILLAMIKFNFYGTIERMHDVIEPLVRACDRRSITYSSGTKSNESAAATVTDEDGAPIFGEDSLNFEEEGIAAEEEQGANHWQSRVLAFFESLSFLCFILVLTCAAVAVTIYQVLSDAPETWDDPYFCFGVAVFIIFVIDYSSRIYCFTWLTGKLCKFMCDPFNVIDLMVILLDVVFFSLPSDIGGTEGNFTKTLRLIRLLRLLRIIRAAKAVHSAYIKVEEVEKWTPPLRYTKVPQSEVDTLLQAQKILYFVQGVIQDRNLSLLLRGFWGWERGDDSRSPSMIFEQVIHDSSELTLGVGDFDQIFIDMLMISNAPLVQGALDVLMARHSARSKLIEHTKQLQLLVSPKRERQFKIIDQMLQQLERNAETHELWGELQSDSDHLTNKQTKDILSELVEICRIRRVVLEPDEEFEADRDIQDLYRNLGCFTICFKMLGLLEGVQEDENGEFSEISLNTRELCRLSNELLYWFSLGNELNQELCYSELDFFLESLEAEIKSHLVIRSIFKRNEKLMKLVSHSLLSVTTDRISKNGKFHGYLALPISITHVNEKNIVKNQFEIMKAFAAPGKFESVSCFLCAPGHSDYNLKLELMAKVGDKFVDFEDLPKELAYHLSFLEMLSNCTVGRINITSVEAKVQSIYDFEDVLACILDPASVVIAKTRLAMHLFNAFVEVELSVPGLDRNPLMWSMLHSYPDVFAEMLKHLEFVRKNGWNGQQYLRQKIEYGLACLNIIWGFFGRYYDPNTLESEKDDQGTNTNSSGNYEKMTLAKANKLIKTLYDSIDLLYKFQSPNLSEVQKTVMHDALEALNKSASAHFCVEVERDYIQNPPSEEAEKSKDELRESEVHAKWQEFLQALIDDEELQRTVMFENRDFIVNFEELPFVNDSTAVSDLRYEVVIQKLVRHITDSMTIVNGEKRIDSEYTKTAIWIIKAFRTMIENKMGMTIYERDDDGGEEQDVAAAPVVTALNENGATALCLDLIATGVDEVLQNEAIKLIVGMLFKEGGARQVQSKVNSYLMNGKSELFFRQVRATIAKLISWHKWNGIIVLEEGQEPEPPEDILIIRFLQLLSEGHYLPNQNIVRDQPNNPVQVNLLDDLVLYINTLSRLQCRTSTNCAIRVAATILEVIQGPCSLNQQHLALNTDLLEVMNRIMRLKHGSADCVAEEEIELKKTVVDIYEALLEGQHMGDVVADRLLSVIHMDIIQVTAMPPDEAHQTEVQPEGTEELAIECRVLLQILRDLKRPGEPSLGGAIAGDAEVETIDFSNDTSTCSVEVSWDGVLNRRFFHVPDVCSLLAKSSKDRLVALVDRSNNENKLIDFLARARDLYREVKHQERLVQLNIAGVFSTLNKDRATWITFLLAWVQNALFVAFYNVRNENLDPQLPSDIETVALALNIVQMFFAAFTVVLTLVVRSPVVAESLLANDPEMSPFTLALRTAMDPMTIYYFGYLILSILGTAVDSYFIALLLLDIIVKNETTAAVLMAVYEPRKQLGYSMLLGFFLFYIFSYYLVRRSLTRRIAIT